MVTSKKHIEIFSVDKDEVVDALVATGRTNYQFALDKLVPLINRLDIQRKIQNPSFYNRLKRDILKKCLMPPITLAFVKNSLAGLQTKDGFSNYLNKNIDGAFVLDGIQRLSTLQRAADSAEKFPYSQPLFVNVLVCKSTDNLLYRMITLNNGQRPMTTRHQIEILTANMFDIDNGSVTLTREKDGMRKQYGLFAKADFVLGYIAFLSNSPIVDSQKVIQEKLDELLANRILEHDPTKDVIQFSNVTELIGKFSEIPELDKWFKIQNNLIGFCAGIRTSFESVKKVSAKDFMYFVNSFEEAFRAFDVAKLKVGRARRVSVAALIRQYKQVSKKSVGELTEKLIDVID